MKVPKETCHERQCMLSLQVKSQTTNQQDTDMIFFLKWLIYSRQVTHHSMLDFPICKMRIILPQAFVLRIEDANTHGVRNHKPQSILLLLHMPLLHPLGLTRQWIMKFFLIFHVILTDITILKEKHEYELWSFFWYFMWY